MPMNVPAAARSICRPPATDPVNFTWYTDRELSNADDVSRVRTRLLKSPAGRPA